MKIIVRHNGQLDGVDLDDTQFLGNHIEFSISRRKSSIRNSVELLEAGQIAMVIAATAFVSELTKDIYTFIKRKLFFYYTAISSRSSNFKVPALTCHINLPKSQMQLQFIFEKDISKDELQMRLDKMDDFTIDELERIDEDLLKRKEAEHLYPTVYVVYDSELCKWVLKDMNVLVREIYQKQKQENK